MQSEATEFSEFRLQRLEATPDFQYEINDSNQTPVTNQLKHDTNDKTTPITLLLVTVHMLSYQGLWRH